MTELETFIHSYFGIQQKNVQNIAKLFSTSLLEKDAFFTKRGKYNTKLSFIKSGYLRVFDSSNGKEITQWIASQGEFITDLSSVIFQTASRWNIQALSNCELYSIEGDAYRSLGKQIPQWERLEKLFIAKCFLSLEDRVYSFLSMSAEERYQQLFQNKMDMFNEVPLHYIASMLGMTPETLSRIRRKSIS